jgi:hypothetical protein
MRYFLSFIEMHNNNIEHKTPKQQKEKRIVFDSRNVMIATATYIAAK